MFQKVLKVAMANSKESPNLPKELVSPPELAVAEVVGRLMHFWGFKRPMGRVWSLLYLSDTPMSAASLGEALKMSAGAISMALSELEKWGAIQRTWIPGERRDYFSAEADIWKLVQRVMRERELGLVRDFTQSLARAENDISERESQLREGTPPEDLDLAAKLSYKRERLARLRHLSETGENLLGALVDGGAVNPSLLFDPHSKA